MINPLIRTIDNWTINIIDNGTAGRNQTNPNKLNYLTNDRTCKIIGCSGVINIRRTSGLCDNHTMHQHDLLLNLANPAGSSVNVPMHKEIIDALILWSSTRNFGLLPFFSSLSFNTLGNVPDVTTLAGGVSHPGIIIPTIDYIYDSLIIVADNFFPRTNNSSYQPLETTNGKIPAIVLAHTFIGLLICEEANRGDRWFSRVVRGDESTSKALGAAMPIAYFATKIFPWGVEMSKYAARNLTL